MCESIRCVCVCVCAPERACVKQKRERLEAKDDVIIVVVGDVIVVVGDVIAVVGGGDDDGWHSKK